MAYEERAGYCRACQERVIVRRKGINHILHLLLTLVTVGLWVFVWLLTPVLRQPWACARCGSRQVDVGEQQPTRLVAPPPTAEQEAYYRRLAEQRRKD